MANREMPAIANMSYTNTSTPVSAYALQSTPYNGTSTTMLPSGLGSFGWETYPEPQQAEMQAAILMAQQRLKQQDLGQQAALTKSLMARRHRPHHHPLDDPEPESAEMENQTMAAQQRRRVRVFIIDPDEKVPVDSCTVFAGDEKLTDLNDQELFFEIDIKSAVDEHNKKRTQIVDKSVNDRSQYLDPVRIRDLKMTVVTIAAF